MEDLDAFAMYGAFYLLIVPLAVFTVIFDELMREKVMNLRRGMQLLGTGDIAYWTSWIITSLVLSAVISLEMVYIGRFLEFKLF